MIRWFTGITPKQLEKERIRIDALIAQHADNIDVAIADRVAAIKTLQAEVVQIENLR